MTFHEYKTAFITSRRNLDRLYECNRISAQVWNDCLKLAKEHYKQSSKWMNKIELQKLTKGKYPIHSQSIQAVVHKYLWARDAARKARQQGRMTARYPYRQKKYFNTRWAKDGFRIYDKGKIELSLGIWQGKRQEPVTVWVKNLPKGKVKEIELIYDRKLMLCLVYDDGVEPEVNHHLSTAAIDLGEIHAISSVSENHEGILITGRKLRSIKRLRNRKLAELQRKMKKCKKGSRQWKKYNKAKRYILSKTNIQLRDALHKISRKFVHWCAEQRIRHVVIGDVEGVQRHTRKKRGKTVNQKLAQWQFGQLLKYLEYTNSRRKESRLKKSMKPIPRKHVLFAPEERNLLVECTSASVVMSNIVIFMAPAIS